MRVYSIDAFRIVAAFLVVSLHVTWIIPGFGTFMTDVERIAVPYFFMVSGYFYKREKTLPTIKRLVKYLFVAIISYFFVEWYIYRSTSFVSTEITVLYDYRFWICNVVPFCPVAWYLTSYIYILVIAFFIKQEKLYYLLGLFSLLFSLSIGAYSHIFNIQNVNSLMWDTCFISSFCWFALGRWLRNRQDLFPKGEGGIFLLLTLLGIFMSIAEHYLIKRYTNAPVSGTVYIGTILSVVSLFIWLLKHPQLGNQLHVGRLPLFIFLSHVAIHYVYVSFFWTSKFSLSYPPLMELPFPPYFLVNNVIVFISACLLYFGWLQLLSYFKKKNEN